MVEKLADAIANSAVFVVLGTKNYVRELKDYNSGVSVQTRIAKKFNKPVIIILHKDLSQDEVIELEDYFSSYNVLKEISLDLRDTHAVEVVTKEIALLCQTVQKKTS